MPVSLDNTVIGVSGIPNRSKGIITAWSFEIPYENETETGISPEMTPSPAHRVLPGFSPQAFQSVKNHSEHLS